MSDNLDADLAALDVLASKVQYPELELRLVDENGNAFAILGRLDKVLRDGGVSYDERHAINAEAIAGDYDHLLQVVMRTVKTS